jgi:thrombospondin motif-containing protein 9
VIIKPWTEYTDITNDDVDEDYFDAPADDEDVTSSSSRQSRSASSSSSSRKNKRSISQDFYVELMVVCDQKMATYHGTRLKHYVLTLMSIVSIQ